MAKHKFTHVLTEELLRKRYLEERKSLEAIGEEVGADRNTVRNYMNRFNIPARTSAESRHVSLDSSGFSELTTDWHAYWTGFLAADGCVFINEKKRQAFVSVVLKMSDADHLRDLQRGLKTTVPVLEGYNGQRDTARIVIYSRDLIAALAQWGVVPNKTLTMPWPTQLPTAAIPAYIRGYFDGDGTIYQRYRSQFSTTWTETVCRFISGSVPFLEGLKRELDIRGIHTNRIYRNQTSNAFVLPLSSRRENLLTFAHLIYTDCTICLERKRAIFREMEAYHADHPRKGAHLRYQVW